jgi:hypothetical protein
MSSEQKDIGLRLALFIGALVTMILLAAFAFPTDEKSPDVSSNSKVSMTETK